MQIKASLSTTEAINLLIPEMANRFGCPDYDVTIEITNQAPQSGVLSSVHKISMIKFMRQVISDVTDRKLILPDDETGGLSPPKTVGLATAKNYVENYLGMI